MSQNICTFAWDALLILHAKYIDVPNFQSLLFNTYIFEVRLFDIKFIKLLLNEVMRQILDYFE